MTATANADPTAGYDALPPQDREVWEAQYGPSARFFWAAESGNIVYEGPAAGFFNLPADQQDDWYGQYGADAGNVWAQQSGAGTGGTGGTGGTSGTSGTGGTPAVARNLPGVYQGTYGGQTVRKGDKGAEGIGFGQTVAPSTWNPASPGRNEGWGTIGAGTAGIEYGYGSPGFGKKQIKINEQDLPHLSNTRVAPGYIPGSGTYNQYDLSQGGLFAEMPLASGGSEVVNTRFGLGGTGDPTTGGETQTPDRWVRGTGSTVAQRGDEAWRRRYGGGGGGLRPLPGFGGGGQGGRGGGFGASPGPADAMTENDDYATYGAKAPAPAAAPPPEPEPAPAASASAPAGWAGSDLARQQMGKPYIYGSGTGTQDRSRRDLNPQTGDPNGFDCSGYTAYVAKNSLGADLPGWTGGQYQATQPVEPGQERPGDLVFWNMNQNDPRQQHVAFYTGDGGVIQAGGTGQGVNEGRVDQYPGAEFRRVAPSQAQAQAAPGTGGAYGGGGGGTGGGTGGGWAESGLTPYFGSTVTSNWGQTDETRGLDYIATLFLRSDTETGIGTPAWSAPQAMWDGLINEIRRGRVFIRNPDAWKMLAEKNPAYTPQNIGGAATGGQNVQPTGGTGTGTGGTGGTGTQANPQYGVAGTFKEGDDTPFGKIIGGLPQGVGFEYHKLLEEKARREAEMAVEQAKLTGVFNGVPTLQAKELEEKIRQNAFDNAMKTRTEDRLLRQQDLDEAYRKVEYEFKNRELDQQIAVKREEIASIAATGDKDRAQREVENLREMEKEKMRLAQEAAIATGFVGDKATIEMQKFLADQQAAAYERAANPAQAFENELARGATGWNQPGVDPAAAGVPGVTAPGQNLQQWVQAGGYAQNAQPVQGATQPYGYGYGQPGGTPQAAPGYGGTAQGAAGATVPLTPEQQQAAAAAGQGATQAQMAPQATAYGAAPAAQTAAAGGTGATQQPQAMAAYLAQSVAQPQAQAQTAQAQPAETMVRTPAAVNAFRAGGAMPTAGSYAYSSDTRGASKAVLNSRDFRTQNLKQTRKMSPVTRAIIGSYGKAGGVDEDTQAYYSDRKAPGASASGSYALS